jgi:hypothetical protein
MLNVRLNPFGDLAIRGAQGTRRYCSLKNRAKIQPTMSDLWYILPLTQ